LPSDTGAALRFAHEQIFEVDAGSRQEGRVGREEQGETGGAAADLRQQRLGPGRRPEQIARERLGAARELVLELLEHGKFADQREQRDFVARPSLSDHERRRLHPEAVPRPSGGRKSDHLRAATVRYDERVAPGNARPLASSTTQSRKALTALRRRFSRGLTR